MAASYRKSSLPAAGPALTPLGHHEGKPPIALARPVIVIGSRSSARIHLLSRSVSKAHALLVQSNGRTYIHDLASRSKVIVNNNEVLEAVLEDGDMLQIGSFTFRYDAGPGEDNAPAGKEPIPAKLEVSGSEYPVTIEQRVILIGRRASADINLLEESVSTAHAVIFEMNGQRFVRDLGSRTGTFVNGVSTHQHQLSPGDTIRIGETDLKYLANEVSQAVVVEEEPVKPEVKKDPFKISPPPQPPKAADEPEITIEPEEEPIAISSTDIEADEPAISVEPELVPESLSPPAIESEKPIEIEPAAELNPRKGWRSTAVEPPSVVEPAKEEIEEVAAVEEVAPEEIVPPAEEVTEPVEAIEPPLEVVEEPKKKVLEFPDPISVDEPIDETSDSDSATAVLDLATPEVESTPVVPDPGMEFVAPAPLPEPPEEVGDIDLRPDEPLSLPDVEAPPVKEEPQPTLELPKPVIPPPLPPVQKIEAPTLKMPAVKPPPAPVEKPVESPELKLLSVKPPPPLKPISDKIKPPPIVPAKKRGRKSKKQLAEEAAALAAENAALDKDVNPLEIVEPTEPTLESALPTPVENLPLDTPPSTDDLTDTTFGREVSEFSGAELGELVEPPPLPPIAEKIVPPPVLEIPHVEASPAIEEIVEPPLDTLPQAKFDAVVEPPVAVDVTQEKVEPIDTLSDADFDALIGEEVTPAVDETIEPAKLDMPAVEASAAKVEIPPVEPLDTLSDADADALADDIAIEPPVETVELPLEEKPQAEKPADDPSQPRIDLPWGAANHENHLGGKPLDLSQPALSDTPVSDQAVEELLNEIDTVAAAAEAASIAPVPPEATDEDVPPIMPAIPPRPRKLGVFRGSRRKRDDQPAATNGEKPQNGEITTGFDALAMPGVREVDVFSQMSPPAADEEQAASAPLTPMDQVQPADDTTDEAEVAGGFQAPDGTFISEDQAEDKFDPRRQRVMPALPGTVDGVIVGERRPSVTYAAELTEAEARLVRRKYFRRACAMAGAMVVLIGLTTFAIFWFATPLSSLSGTVAYRNLSELTQDERMRFEVEQKRLLSDDATRRVARRKLAEKPEITPAFLDDYVEYCRVTDHAGFTSETPYVMQIHLDSKDPEGDRARMAAMMAALYDNNSLLLDDAVRQRRSLEDLNDQIKTDKNQLDALNGSIEKLRTQGESKPSSDKIAQLENESADLEKAWNEAVAAQKAAQAELERIKSAPAGDASTTQPDVAANDDKIKMMQSQLDELTGKLDAAKSANAQKSTDARKSLDTAFDTFQKQIADAQSMMSGNPELSAYIEAAKNLQETTRQLTDELIRRQEQQFARLTDLKQRLNEKMEQRRVELWQGDKELQDLTERQAVLERQYNAAVGGGLKKEADEAKNDLDLTNNMIKARQDLLPGDNSYADAIQELQVILDSTKKNIDEDRAKTEEVLAELQKSFTAPSNEAIEKMPQEQKELVASLQRQLDQINTARQQYNQAVDAGAADSDAQMKQQLVTLRAAIDGRRKELADQNLKNLKDQQEQNRLTTVDAMQAELNKLNDAETAAREKYFDKDKELRAAKAAVADAKDSSQRLEEMMRQKDVLQRSLEADLAQVENKQNNVKHAVEPIKPADSDLTIRTANDKRLAYTFVSDGFILVIFVGMILWTLHTASLEAPAGSIQATDLRPIPEQKPAADSNGKSHGSEEDHEPAIV